MTVSFDPTAPLDDYSDLAFDELYTRLENLRSSAWAQIQTDRSKVAFYNILFGSVAHVFDLVMQYVNNMGLQSRVVTADQRIALLGLLKLINFLPRGATAATVDVVFTLPAAIPDASVTIPIGKQVRTESPGSPVNFQTTEVALIPANDLTVTVPCKNSETHDETFPSTSRPDQQFLLTFSPFLDDTSSVVAGNGVYTKVDNFFDSTSTDRHYLERVDQDDRGRLVFGDGRNGTIPTGDIVATYETGGGVVGNVNLGAIRLLDQDILDSMSRPVVLSVNNPAAASGGFPRMTEAEMRFEGPKSLRLLERAIAHDDFEIGAGAVPGVSRALALTKNQDPAVEENETRIYIVPLGGGVASQGLLDQVLAQFVQAPGGPVPPFETHITHVVKVFSSLYFTVNVGVKVHLTAAGQRMRATASQQIRQAIRDFFADRVPPLRFDGKKNANAGLPNPRIDWGINFLDENGEPTNELPWSQIQDAVDDVTYVRKVDDGPNGLTLNDQRADLVIPDRLFPVLGNIVLIDGAGVAF